MLAFMDFLSSNKLIKYPIHEKAELPTEIPTDFFIDMVINTQADVEYYINKIIVNATDYLVYINDKEISVPKARTTNGIYTYNDADVSIKCVIGTNILQLVAGEHLFTLNQTKIEPCCTVIQHIIVSSVVVREEVLKGDVKLKSGYNCDVKEDLDSGEIELNAFSGAGLGTPECDADPYVNVDRKPIYTVNNTPYEEGFWLNRSECVEVLKRPKAHMVILNDICEPCCKDCDVQLVDITDQVNLNEENIIILSGKVTALEPIP